MAKIARVKEIAIEKLLRERIEALGGLCLKVTVLGRRGFPDRLIVLPGGKVVFCELKRPRGQLGTHQAQYLYKLSSLGTVACVVQSKQDMEALLDYVKERAGRAVPHGRPLI